MLTVTRRHLFLRRVGPVAAALGLLAATGPALAQQAPAEPAATKAAVVLGLADDDVTHTVTTIPGTTVSVVLSEFSLPAGVTPAANPFRWRIQDVGAPQFRLRVRNLDALIERTRVAGYRFLSVGAKPIQRPFGRFVFAIDPDGVLVEFVEPASQKDQRESKEGVVTRGWSAVPAAVMALTSVAAPGAQDVTVEPDQQYLVLEVVKLDTFEKEINSAADQGFRLMMSTTSDNGARIQALMARAATAPDVFHYRVVATFSEKTGDREMNAAAADGFRVVPHTSMVKKGITIFNTNTVVVMEKSPHSSAVFEYRTIGAVKTATFHRELKAAVDEGWSVVDTTYGRVLLEREKTP